MNSITCDGGRGLAWGVLALSLGIGLTSAGPTQAGDRGAEGHHHKRTNGWGVVKRFRDGGTLGYGPPGIHPGFQGFGLGFHPGYGYGGDALGVGAEGGYPFYGGPGYPHPAPRLRRIGGINPFPHYAGPGFPTPGHENYYGDAGPLVADKPVITIMPEPGEADYASGFGAFTGTVPLPESYFAPYTSEAAAGGSASGVTTTRPGQVPAEARPAAPNPRD